MSTTFDDYAKRYQGSDWRPKELRGTKMNNAPSDPVVIQLNMPERIVSEPDFSHQYLTSNMPHFAGLVQVTDGNVRNLQTVLFNSEADKQMRRNALRQLQTNVTQRDCEDSRAVLTQWQECGLTLD